MASVAEQSNQASIVRRSIRTTNVGQQFPLSNRPDVQAGLKLVPLPWLHSERLRTGGDWPNTEQIISNRSIPSFKTEETLHACDNCELACKFW